MRQTFLTQARALPSLLLLALVLATTACADAPVLLKYEVKGAIQAARDAEADTYAGDLLGRAEAAYRAGTLAMDLEGERWSPARDYDPAITQLETALARARLARQLSISRKSDLATRAEALLVDARASIQNLNFIFSYLPPRTRARSDLMHARVLVEEAVTLRKRGDLAPAVERAGAAAQETALIAETLARIIDRFAGSDRMADYRRWIRDTVRESEATGDHAILVDKLRHTLTLIRGGRVVRTYRAELGLNGSADKTVSGDKATPEGRYRIVEKKDLGETHWHRALLINYPNDGDRAQFAEAQRRGLLPRRARIGGLIEVHGEGGRFQDWTEGCIALDNDDIDELFRLVAVGTPITIVGYEGDNWLEIQPARDGRPEVTAERQDGPAPRSRRSGSRRGERR
ncbi:MAG: L,D-transpeptidase [Acidobacteria bacterium]|nr:L,D-transpeptidase [Acidobacteriota bacterium]